jgi:hypothetical protein
MEIWKTGESPAQHKERRFDGELPKAFEGRFLICEGIRDFQLALDERVLRRRQSAMMISKWLLRLLY